MKKRGFEFWSAVIIALGALFWLAIICVEILTEAP